MKILQKITIFFILSLIQSMDLQASNFGSMAKLAKSCLTTIGNNKVNTFLTAATMGNFAYKKYLFDSILEPKYVSTKRNDKVAVYGDLSEFFGSFCLLGAMISSNFKISGFQKACQVGALCSNVGMFLHLRFQLQQKAKLRNNPYYFIRNMHSLIDHDVPLSKDWINNDYFRFSSAKDKNGTLLRLFLLNGVDRVPSDYKKIIFEAIAPDYIRSLDSEKKIEICEQALKNGHFLIAKSMIDQNLKIFDKSRLEHFYNSQDYSQEQVQVVQVFLQKYISTIKLSEE